MSRATSNFLQGANAANAASAAARSAGAEDPGAPEDVEVLAAVDMPEVVDLDTLAKHFGLEVADMEEAVRKLSKKGYIEVDGGNLKLSRGGERALRYTSLAKF